MFLDNPMRLPFSGFASSLALAGDVDGDGAGGLPCGRVQPPLGQQ